MAAPVVANVSRPELREVLNQLLRTDSALNAFCIDYFHDELFQYLGNGMDRVQKVTALLTIVDPGQIEAALRKQCNPDAVDAALLKVRKRKEDNAKSPSQEALEKELQALEQQLAHYRREKQPVDELNRRIKAIKVNLEQLRQCVELRLECDVLLASRYLLEAPLGEGGFGEVWRAFDRHTRNIVALKILHRHKASDSNQLARFQRGAKKAQGLDHPHLIRVLDVPKLDQGLYYYPMEFLDGGDLRAAILAKRLDQKQAIRVLLQVCQALQYLHDQGFVHRDVKPTNILLDKKGQARLSDFDLVKADDSVGGTRSGERLGTHLYLAPEQNDAAAFVGPAADVHAFAMTVIFVLRKRELVETEYRRLETVIAELRCTKAVKKALLQAVAEKPEDRPPLSRLHSLLEPLTNPGVPAAVPPGVSAKKDMSTSPSPDGPVRIVVAGQTNAGKTTLIGTLLKAKVGKTEDNANTTRGIAEFDYQSYSGLQAVFVDTPGFDLLYSEAELSSIPDLAEYEAGSAELQPEQKALQAIISGDAILYVATLEQIPSRRLEKELDLVSKANSKIIGILNKSRIIIKGHDGNDSVLKNRIRLWIQAFSKHKIDKFIVFDAHWDKPSKVSEIHNAISEYLSKEKKDKFRLGLKEFDKRQADILTLACQKVADCIEICISRGHHALNAEVYGSDLETMKQEVAKRLDKNVQSALMEFISSVSSVYKISMEDPITPINENSIIYTTYHSSPGFWEQVKNGASAGTSFARLGAAVGAGVGAIVAGVLSGGLAASGGAALGGKIGAAIGGIFGAAKGATSDSTTNQRAGLSPEACFQIECLCLAAVWAFSHHGFGLRSEITAEQLVKLTQEVRLKNDPRRTQADSRDERIARYRTILQELEQITV